MKQMFTILLCLMLTGCMQTAPAETANLTAAPAAVGTTETTTTNMTEEKRFRPCAVYSRRILTLRLQRNEPKSQNRMPQNQP